MGNRASPILVALGSIALCACPNSENSPDDTGVSGTVRDTGSVIDAAVDTGVESADGGGQDAEVTDADPPDLGAPDSGDDCGNGAVEPNEACDPALSACCAADCSGPADMATSCRAAAFDCDAEEFCDGASLECPADSVAANDSVCDDCFAGPGLCASCLSGACADRPYYCADILADGNSVGDGIYEINPARTPTVATVRESVYCDMTTDGGGWTMVHKKSRLAPVPAALVWTGGATNADNLTLLSRDITDRNYLSTLVDENWTDFAEARFEVVTGTVVNHWIHFDTTTSTTTDWFAPDRLAASSWVDLPTDPNFDNNNGRMFRIGGGVRDWYINIQWGGCPSDRGWLMVTSWNFCFWEGTTGDPNEIIYSVGTSHGSATNAETAFADSVLIFLR